MTHIPLPKKLDILQNNIDYQFTNINLLEQALCHRSIVKSVSNERLEFLGDRVLGLVISEYLFLNFNENEGKLAKRYNVWVCKESCAIAAKKIDLGRFLMLSHSEEDNGGRERQTTLGNAFEALIAAIYLDSDLETARHFILTLWADMLEADAPIIDPKSELQEWSQKYNLGIPLYKIIHKEGSDHEPIFTVELKVKNHDPLTAKGKSKRQGEFQVALDFLKKHRQ